MKLGMRRTRTERAGYEPPTARLPLGPLGALAALVFAALLLVPGNAQAAVSLVGAIITDPVKTSSQARVDANGNLLVASGFQPVHTHRFANLIVNGVATVVDVYSVPAGKRLIIQYVQGTVNYPANMAKPLLQIQTIVGGTIESWNVETPTPGAAAGGFLNFAGSKQVSLYAEPSTVVRFFLGSFPATGDVQAQLVISGVLVDATAGVAQVPGA